MTFSGETIKIGPSTLHDEAFYDPPSVEIGTDLMIARCLSNERSQVLIDAPRLVDASRETIPVIGVWCRTLSEDQRMPWADLAAVVAVRLDDGESVAARVFPWKQSEAQPALPDDDPGEGYALDPFHCDLRARAPSLPWDGGTFALTVLIGDYASQRVFSHRPGAPPSVPCLASPAPREGGFSSYLPGPATPAVPASHGVALDPSRVLVLAPGVRCVLTGSFRLPATIALPAPEDAEVQGRRYGCVAPITLVITRDDALEPVAIPLRLPCFDAAGDDVTGVFSIDLFEVADFSREPGRVRLWAFAGPMLEGPFPIQLVSEDELAPP